jgi:hypothetical protein
LLREIYPHLQGGALQPHGTPATFFTFFIGTLKEVWTSSHWGQLLSLKVFFSVELFVFSLFIPKIIKKLRKEK